jgi:hypothetical protein
MATNSLITLAPAVVFLGAGASAPLGKPTMAGFMPKLIESLQARFVHVPGVKDLLSYLSDDLEELLEQLASMANMPFAKAFTIRPYGGAQSASAAQHDIDPGEGAVKGASVLGYSAPAMLRAAVHKAVIQEYRWVDGSQATALYGPLFELLFTLFGEPSKTQKGVWPGLRSALLPVFTTNYDPAIEAFCERNFTNYSLVDGFKYNPAERKESWSPEHFDIPTRHLSKRNLALFKLHGSADWITVASRIQRAEPRYVPDGEEHWNNCLVYPAKKKVSLEDPYFTCYDYLQQCLQNTRICLTIGYSFRDYDALTRVKSAMLNNDRLILVLISPNANELARELGFPGERVRSIALPFGHGETVAPYMNALKDCLETELSVSQPVVNSSQ